MAMAATAAVEAVKTLNADGWLEHASAPCCGTGRHRWSRRAWGRTDHHRRWRDRRHHRPPRQGTGWTVHAEPAVVDHRVRGPPRRRATEQRWLGGRRRKIALVALQEPEQKHQRPVGEKPREELMDLGPRRRKNSPLTGGGRADPCRRPRRTGCSGGTGGERQDGAAWGRRAGSSRRWRQRRRPGGGSSWRRSGSWLLFWFFCLVD